MSGLDHDYIRTDNGLNEEQILLLGTFLSILYLLTYKAGYSFDLFIFTQKEQIYFKMEIWYKAMEMC